MPDDSSNLVFFVCHGTHVYLLRKSRKSVKYHALCLAMGSDRIIAKQGRSLLGLSLNWYVMTQIVYVYYFYQSQFTLFWNVFGEEACRFEKLPKFFTPWYLRKYNKCHENLTSQLLKFIKNNVVITIRQLYFASTIVVSQGLRLPSKNQHFKNNFLLTILLVDDLITI